MRCFFMRRGHIRAVEFLSPGTDEDLIEQGQKRFRERTDRVDGFEVWDGTRKVHVYPEDDGPQNG